jgi:uncharacterized protein YkwD
MHNDPYAEFDPRRLSYDTGAGADPDLVDPYFQQEVEPSSHRRPAHPVLLLSAGVLAVAIASVIGAAIVSDRSEPRPASAAVGGPRQVVAVPPTADPVNPSPTATAAPTATAPPTVAPTTAPPARTSPPAKPKPKPPEAKPKPDQATEDAVLTLVNQERAGKCDALTIDSRLATAARKHSADMAARNFFSHDTPEGVSVATRVTNAGYKWSSVGENIAMGQQTAASVMESWMNSPGHRANILNCGYKHIGIGLAYRGKTPYWTQDFGSQF